ncbi:hypothetical protein LPJ63_002237 [Coemansia sp. RSA 2711]|nr:hypothetical protein LPJ63_002237 [Coemansia sp. RSA 2711]
MGRRHTRQRESGGRTKAGTGSISIAGQAAGKADAPNPPAQVLRGTSIKGQSKSAQPAVARTKPPLPKPPGKAQTETRTDNAAMGRSIKGQSKRLERQLPTHAPGGCAAEPGGQSIKGRAQSEAPKLRPVRAVAKEAGAGIGIARAASKLAASTEARGVTISGRANKGRKRSRSPQIETAAEGKRRSLFSYQMGRVLHDSQKGVEREPGASRGGRATQKPNRRLSDPVVRGVPQQRKHVEISQRLTGSVPERPVVYVVPMSVLGMQDSLEKKPATRDVAIDACEAMAIDEPAKNVQPPRALRPPEPEEPLCDIELGAEVAF